MYPGPPREAGLYEDDGESLDYTRGEWLLRQVTSEFSDRAYTVQVGSPSGPYKPKPRTLEVSVPWAGEPSRIVVGDGQAVTRVAPDAFRTQASGWTVDQGFVIVRQPDSFGVVRVTIER